MPFGISKMKITVVSIAAKISDIGITVGEPSLYIYTLELLLPKLVFTITHGFCKHVTAHTEITNTVCTELVMKEKKDLKII